jgi:phage FluMu gp28-like protein
VAKIMYLRMARWLRRADGAQDIWSANDAELFIGLVNGSRIYFKGGDRPDLLYGPDSWGVVIDEGTRVREEVFHAARSLVTKTRAPIKIVGNMRGRKNWMYRLWTRGRAGEPQISAHRLTADDAVAGGVLSEAEIVDARSALPETVFKELYLAEPSDDEGNPFGLEAVRRQVAPLSPAVPVAFGVDLAKSVDYTVVLGLDAQGRTCRLERFQAPWDETCARVLRALGRTPALCDATGLGDPIVERLQRAGANVEGFLFSAPSKQGLMEGLAVAIQQGEVTYPDGVVPAELESFEYEYTRTGVRYRQVEGLHDDTVAALALAVRCKGQGGATRFF